MTNRSRVAAACAVAFFMVIAVNGASAQTTSRVGLDNRAKAISEMTDARVIKFFVLTGALQRVAIFSKQTVPN